MDHFFENFTTSEFSERSFWVLPKSCVIEWIDLIGKNCIFTYSQELRWKDPYNLDLELDDNFGNFWAKNHQKCPKKDHSAAPIGRQYDSSMILL